MHVILDLILTILTGQDQQEVYPSFDAVPVRNKPKALFSVVTPVSMQIEQPFPYGVTAASQKAYPFSGVYQVSVLIPITEALDTAWDYFHTVTVPRMETLGSILCDVMPPHADAKLNRVVMEGRFRLCGVYVEEVNAET